MKLISTLGALFFSGLLAASPVHDIVVFGDSLSDNGNLYEYMKHQLPVAPYFEGRFSNGPVWIESLSEFYFRSESKHLINLAMGGAGVSSTREEPYLNLADQVDNYLSKHDNKVNHDRLFIIWIGANNYLGLPADAAKAVKEVNAGIKESAQRLVGQGARHMLFLNLPNLGDTPMGIEWNLVDKLNDYTLQHNQELSRVVDDLKKEYPDADLHYFDMNKTFKDVLDHATDYGFSNVTQTCTQAMLFSANVNETNDGVNPVLAFASQMQYAPDYNMCAGYLFFDLVHPTAVAHKLLADKIEQMIEAAGIKIEA